MALVAYSDSEGSDSESPQVSANTISRKPAQNFAIDKTQPGKIKVNLQQKLDPSINGGHKEEPNPKRQKLGESTFSGFNSLLPAPKRDNVAGIPQEALKATTRRVFSLKTGAEASFSRDSDAELRNTSVGQNTANTLSPGIEGAQQSTLQMPSFAKPAKPAQAGSSFLFKPLSVARGQRKRPANTAIQNGSQPLRVKDNSLVGSTGSSAVPKIEPEAQKKKINLFSSGSDYNATLPDQESATEATTTVDDEEYYQDFSTGPSAGVQDQPVLAGNSQSLDSIASDLNLTAAQRRQLFGRAGQKASSAISVANFNTDEEYAANQALIATGETIQHNPVRAIAPGKHSLRQLVGAASGQKEALEESFAEGRRNKKEAGNKYGW